jgi:flagellar motor switch protein FliM
LKEKKKFFYSSTIKLPPAIGDWTEIKSFNSQNDFFEITDVNYSNFDGISKEDLKFVQKIHHRIASQMIDHLSYNLNAKVELHTISATQLLYSDFIESISDNVFQSTINLPEKSSINILFGSNLASMVIDRLVGGKGTEDVKQEFNPLEMDLLSEQIQNFIPFFQSAWEDVLDFSDVNVSLSSGKYVKDHQISLRGTMVVFTIYLFFGDGELLRLIVAYPSKLISRLLHLYRSKKRHIKSSVKLDKNTIKDINYKVVAELGTIKLTMDAIQKLDVGDIISLDKPIHSYIKLKIGDDVTLTGQPCVYKKRLGCQIVVASQIKSAIKLVHDSYQNDVHNHSPRVTFSLDSLVEDRSIDSISNMDHGINSPVVSSEELAQFIPADLLSINDNEVDKETSISKLEPVSEFMPTEDIANFEPGNIDLEVNDAFEATQESELEPVSEFMPTEDIANFEPGNIDLEVNDTFEATQESKLEPVSEFIPEEETANFEPGNVDLEVNDAFEATQESELEPVSEFIPEEETANFEPGNIDLEVNDAFEATQESELEPVSEFMPTEDIANFEPGNIDLEVNDAFEATQESELEPVSEFIPEEETANFEPGNADLEVNDAFEATQESELEPVSEFIPEEETANFEPGNADLEVVDLEVNDAFEATQESKLETATAVMPEEETLEIDPVVNLSDIETDELDGTEDEENIDDVSDTSELNQEQFSSELEELMLEDIPERPPVAGIVLDTESSDADLKLNSDNKDDGSSLENNKESDSESFSYLNDIQFFDGETLESNDKDTL